MNPDVLVLGCGYTGSAVATQARARGLSVVATVRSEERAAAVRAKLGQDIEVVAAARLEPELVISFCGRKTTVVVCFPPDGDTDARIAARLQAGASDHGTRHRVGAIAYVSTTGVYGARTGVIDDATPVESPAGPRAGKVLAAEQAWRTAGATVLRCPGIYGADRGLHQRIVRGEHRIAGDGSTYTSRIHVEDLASLLLATAHERGQTFAVGDGAPATQQEIGEWVAAEYGVPVPPHVPREEVHETLRADRRVDGSRALAVLGVTLRYPHYRDGMARPR